VPASYLQVGAAPEPEKKAIAAVKTPTQYVRSLYDYAAQGSDELSLVEGAKIELTPLGQNYGDGWWEGIANGKKGIFPNNYVELI